MNDLKRFDAADYPDSEALYKALAPGAKPRYETIMKVLHGLGVKLTVQA